MACTKSGAVSSSHFAESADCETALLVRYVTKRAATRTLRTDFIDHLGCSEHAIVICGAACGHGADSAVLGQFESASLRGESPDKFSAIFGTAKAVPFQNKLKLTERQ